MSESPVTLREKLVKFGTWIFLVFLFGIIVFSFGMPDFMGSSARMDAYNAAKIGGEYLTKAEVAEYQKRIEERMMQNMKGLDDKNRKLFEDMAKSRALDEAIDRKIFTQILNKAGYVPASSSEAKILANFYKRQFSEYIVNGKLDTERLNEFLAQRRLSLDQIGRNMLHDYGPQKAFEMLQATSYASDFAVLDDMRFASTQNSFKIIAIDAGAKDKLLRSRFNPSEQEIQDKFKAEFLSKDAKSVLDQPKRESIRATLFNEKRAALEKDFAASLTQASKGGIDAVAAAAGAKAITVDDVGLAGDLDAKKGKDNAAVTLSPLSQSEVFVKQRLAAPVGQIVGPVDAGGFTYFFAVTARKSTPLPNAIAYAKIENGAGEAAKIKDLPKDVTFDKTFESAGKNNYGQLLTAALEIHRNSTRIIRYNKAKETADAKP
ncbi:MAG: SurA N-terminal domain-containing protein [Spirochaetes bacterium]|nr:SurA N-terminal domain-containing protein [Spirochaetota bacterium]MBX3723634.1 SurA N-terminal domain-containing protein [Turneriella sp.]